MIKEIKELLSVERIHLAIEPENKEYLSGIEIFDSIDSTNTYLIKKIKQNAPSGWICLAEQQTHGRGRLGKSWFSPAGANIYCSMLWRFVDPHLDISGLGIAIGVMVVNALHQYGIQSGLQLKWPNDVLVAGRKLSGILLERSACGAVVIGIGLNIDVKEAEEKNWIDISELMGPSIARNFLVGLLLNEMLKKLPEFERRGLVVFLPEWQKYDALLNKEITIITPGKNIVGVMRGVNSAGELLLENENGVQCFRYGEVSVQLS